MDGRRLGVSVAEAVAVVVRFRLKWILQHRVCVGLGREMLLLTLLRICGLGVERHGPLSAGVCVWVWVCVGVGLDVGVGLGVQVCRRREDGV